MIKREGRIQTDPRCFRDREGHRVVGPYDANRPETLDQVSDGIRWLQEHDGDLILFQINDQAQYVMTFADPNEAFEFKMRWI